MNVLLQVLVLQTSLSRIRPMPPPLPALTRLALLDRTAMNLVPPVDIAALLPRCCPGLARLELSGLSVPAEASGSFCGHREAGELEAGEAGAAARQQRGDVHRGHEVHRRAVEQREARERRQRRRHRPDA